MAGAPKGNNNARKAKVWTLAIERALKKRSKVDIKDALDELAEQLLLQCEAGDLAALKELGDRLEGKPTQGVELGLMPEDEETETSNISIARTLAFALDQALKAKSSESSKPEDQALH